jgi:hypothetical protein
MSQSNTGYLLSRDVFCFTELRRDKYHTIAVACLTKSSIDNDKPIESWAGKRRMIGGPAKSMFLIPYDDPDGRSRASRTEIWDLYPGEEPSENMLKTIRVPVEFNLDVEPYFHYKIEGNFLFRRHGTGWILDDALPIEDKENED